MFARLNIAALLCCFSVPGSAAWRRRPQQQLPIVTALTMPDRPLNSSSPPKRPWAFGLNPHRAPGT